MTFSLTEKLQRAGHKNDHDDDGYVDDDLVQSSLATDRAGIITTMMRRI